MELKQNVIIKVEKDSIAEELGIEPGDILLAINGQPVRDVFDYRYLINEEYLEMTIKTIQGEEVVAEIEKDYDEDIGIVFESGLMDNAKSCRNKCIFCFIDQLPKGMRDTLYFKDDDSRLSFLQGNYVTLTNMSEEDIQHIIFYHLSPINVSVHTTDLELRKKMLQNPNADKVLSIMKRLADAGIEMNLQVVLCRGINDGEILDKTIADCASFFPHAKSMSVVPIGLTRYRDNLYPMVPFDKESSIAVIQQVQRWQKKLKKEIGTSFVFASDEFYLKADRGMPSCEEYEDFAQYENGIGMIALMEAEFLEALEELNPKDSRERTFSIATGEAAYALISRLASRLIERCPKYHIQVFAIKNDFFGGEITVSGLLTGQDIIKQLKGKDLGEYLMLPDSLLRNDTTVLLDDITIEDIEKALDIPIKITLNSGEALLKNMLNWEEQTL
jgi:putative radical SAM enzyme (TIGR03279 family)